MTQIRTARLRYQKSRGQNPERPGELITTKLFTFSKPADGSRTCRRMQHLIKHSVIVLYTPPVALHSNRSVQGDTRTWWNWWPDRWGRILERGNLPRVGRKPVANTWCCSKRCSTTAPKSLLPAPTIGRVCRTRGAGSDSSAETPSSVYRLRALSLHFCQSVRSGLHQVACGSQMTAPASERTDELSVVPKEGALNVRVTEGRCRECRR